MGLHPQPAECENGQNGPGLCPTDDSLDLQDLVPLCNHRYKFVSSLAKFDSNETNVQKRANKYCNSIGGILGIPKCVTNWVPLVHNHTRKATYVWTGLYFGDPTLPNMYRQEITSEDRAVLYHGVRTLFGAVRYSRVCVVSYRDMMVTHLDCFQSSDDQLSYGAVCEFRTKKKNGGGDDYSSGIRFATVYFSPHRHQNSLFVCTGGHVTHAFLLCGSSQYKVCGEEEGMSPCTFAGPISHTRRTPRLINETTLPVGMFSCGHVTSVVSYTLVCNIIADCPDESDELFCKHPVCINTFTCSNGQCVSYDKSCDGVSHCQDESDENSCLDVKNRPSWPNIWPPPVLVDFDNIRMFVSRPLHSNDSCPGSHYRCPGGLNDCLPVYTRCNEVHDCIDHQDEEDCEDVTCPGLFRCRASRSCVHADHLCDGWPHCPMHDDELSCGVVCPRQCRCQGLSFLCTQPVSARAFPQLRFLDVTGSGMALSDVSDNIYLVHLVFSHCSLTQLPDMELPNLKFLDLSSNQFQRVNMSYFVHLENLESLILSNNPITLLLSDSPSDIQHDTLMMIDMSHTLMQVFDTQVLAMFPDLQTLNLSFANIHTISPSGFQHISQLEELLMDHNPVKTFPSTIFKDLSRLRIISTQNYKLCCDEILPQTYDSLSCYAPKDELSSCKDLLQSWTYRACLWLFAGLSVTGNIFCFCTRLFSKSLTSSSGYSVFVTNLTMADFLMGVYISIIGTSDEVFRGRYLYHDDAWKTSVTCKMAGFLSLLSSEVSAFTIWLITLDRFLVVCFPFSRVRFQKGSAVAACLLIWLIGWVLALSPLLPVTSHWEFYSQTGICIPLPVTRQGFKGRLYSVGVLIVLNFVLFLLISTGQGLIYWSIQKNALRTNSTKVSQDMAIARRLITIAVTDFLCWFPIGVCGILASAGVPIPGDVNVALAIFVLPLNSAINPFIYTLNTVAEKRKKSHEAKLLKWLESCSDLTPGGK